MPGDGKADLIVMSIATIGAGFLFHIGWSIFDLILAIF